MIYNTIRKAFRKVFRTAAAKDDNRRMRGSEDVWIAARAPRGALAKCFVESSAKNSSVRDPQLISYVNM